jgi:outer membrane receptor for ferrienterochelin and colicins
VVLRSVATGQEVKAEAGAGGQFTFAGLVPGAYLLTATRGSWEARPQQLLVHAGEVVNAGPVQLAPAGLHQEIVVSAARASELQQESPSPVVVVTAKDFQQTGFATVGAGLSQLTNLDTRNNTYGDGGAAGEQIEGMDSKQTQVLLDGLPLAGARGIREGILDLSQISSAPLSRVEVVEGPASALYGSDAAAGVINLITRTPERPLELQAEADGGSLGAVNSHVTVGSHWQRWSALANFDHGHSQGYALLPGSSLASPEQDRHSGLLKLDYSPSMRWHFAFLSTADAGESTGGDTNTAVHDRSGTQADALTAAWTLDASSTLTARAYESRYDEDSFNLAAGAPGIQTDPGNVHERYRRADFTYRRQLGAEQLVQAGYELAGDRYTGDNRLVNGAGGEQVSTQDFWAQDQWQATRALLVTGGVRLQHHSMYGNHAVPKLGATLRLNGHFRLRGAYGQGFRAPDLGDLYYHLLHLDYGYQVLGNPQLRPETSQSYSGGPNFSSQRLEISLNLFHNHLHNLIDPVLVCDATAGQDCSGAALAGVLAGYGVPASYDYDSSGAAAFTFVNLNTGEAVTEGAELNGRVALGKGWRMDAGYTWLHAFDAATGAPLDNRSGNRAHWQWTYTPATSGFTANLRGDFYGRWYTGLTPTDQGYAYSIWDAYAAQRLSPAVQIFAAVNNLNNSRDRKLTLSQPSFDRLDYGRTLQIGLRFMLP